MSTAADGMRTDAGPRRVLVEACVTGVDEALAAEAAGADRLELCRDLGVGGLSPTAVTLSAVLDSVTVPVNVMVRLRPGRFVAEPGEVADMVREIERVLGAGADGLVVGLLGPEGEVDADAVRRLVTAARDRPVTFHRAFDETPDPVAALGTLADLGVARVLTGGGPGTALSGTSVLAELVRRGGDDVVILAGGGVRGDHVARLVDATGVGEVHARATAIPELVAAVRLAGK